MAKTNSAPIAFCLNRTIYYTQLSVTWVLMSCWCQNHRVHSYVLEYNRVWDLITTKQFWSLISARAHRRNLFSVESLYEVPATPISCGKSTLSKLVSSEEAGAPQCREDSPCGLLSSPEITHTRKFALFNIAFSPSVCICGTDRKSYHLLHTRWFFRSGKMHCRN